MANKRTLPLAALQQTLAYLFDDRPHELAAPFAAWLESSKPFALFAQSYQQKIRKKVRMAQDAEEARNLYCELLTAYLLLQEPRFAVEYEPYGKQQGRSADFAVTHRTRQTFHVEVTRMRPPEQTQPAALVRRSESRRLADVVCDKLGQLSPTTPNVLLIWTESAVLHEPDVAELLLSLKRRAEQRDAGLLARHGFRDTADFIRGYQRLGALLVQSLQAPEGGGSPLVWSNNDARHPLPAKLRELLCSLVGADRLGNFTARPIESDTTPERKRQ